MSTLGHPEELKDIAKGKRKIKKLQQAQKIKETKGHWVKVEGGIQNLHKFIKDETGENKKRMLRTKTGG